LKKVPVTEIAAVIRSKNSGPYELTFDILFKDEKVYRQVKKIDFFSPPRIARIYGVTQDKIIKIVYFDPAFAVKITMVRPVVSGSPGDTDVYGAQQHAPLLGLQIPLTEAPSANRPQDP
jgi:hypothetical protein